jgi:hypothetical protein
VIVVDYERLAKIFAQLDEILIGAPVNEIPSPLLAKSGVDCRWHQFGKVEIVTHCSLLSV